MPVEINPTTSFPPFLPPLFYIKTSPNGDGPRGKSGEYLAVIYVHDYALATEVSAGRSAASKGGVNLRILLLL